MNRHRRNTEESVIELQLLASLPTGKRLRYIPDFDTAAKAFNSKKEPLDFKNGFAYLPHVDKIVNGATPEGADIIRHEFGNKVNPIHAISKGPQIYDVNLTEQHRKPYEDIRKEGLVPVIGGYTSDDGRPQLEIGTSEPMTDEEAIKRMGTEQEGSYRFDPHTGPGVFFRNPNKTHIKGAQQKIGMAESNKYEGPSKEEEEMADKVRQKLKEHFGQLRARLQKIAGTEMTYGGPTTDKEEQALADKEKKRRANNPEDPEPTIIQKDDLNKTGRLHTIGGQRDARGTPMIENGGTCPACKGKGKEYRDNCPTCEGTGKQKFYYSG